MRRVIITIATLFAATACSDDYTPTVTKEPEGAIGASSGANPNVPSAADEEGDAASTGDAWRAEGGAAPPAEKKEPRPQ